MVQSVDRNTSKDWLGNLKTNSRETMKLPHRLRYAGNFVIMLKVNGRKSAYAFHEWWRIRGEIEFAALLFKCKNMGDSSSVCVIS